jgi:pyrimidine-nucleoside phosphorylase
MSLNPALLIRKKRDGKVLTTEEIRDFIRGVTSGDIPDYQASAFLMATWFKGMTLDETAALTQAMVESGERIDLSSVGGSIVDKHSTGGVGDKVTLILAPLAAACGLKVPSMAGRGLGHTGGTIDKLEAIPGYQPRPGVDGFIKQLQKTGCAIISQSEKIAPADRKLYALRDVTSTVDCIPLITASILSKKIAEGTHGLVLDLKVGSGAFMKSVTEARKLGKTIHQVAKRSGLKCRVMLTSMDQPLGCAAGNALEVLECIEILRSGKSGPVLPDLPDAAAPSTDLKELTLQLCAQMLELGGVTKTVAEGRKLANARLADGSAWKKFVEMIVAQGGRAKDLETPEKSLPVSTHRRVVRAGKRGILGRFDTEAVGWALVEMGAGRRQVSDAIDPRVGIILHRKLGAKVTPETPLFTVFFREGESNARMIEIEQSLLAATDITSTRKTQAKLVLEVLG